MKILNLRNISQICKIQVLLFESNFLSDLKNKRGYLDIADGELLIKEIDLPWANET